MRDKSISGHRQDEGHTPPIRRCFRRQTCREAVEAGYGMMEGCSVLPLQLRFVPCGIWGGVWRGVDWLRSGKAPAGRRWHWPTGWQSSVFEVLGSLRASHHAPRSSPAPPRPCKAAVLIAMLRSRPGGQQQLRKAPRGTLSSHLLLASHAPCFLVLA
jgi:hypothetical protein